jgi:arylsulfatase
MSKGCGTIAQVLRGNGYNTSWYGKNHNVPDWQSSQAGPFDLWPSGLGFNYFYGFIGGDTDQWRPALFEGTKPIQPYQGDPSYILDRDLADHAIAWIKMQKAVAPQKPFFAYYATGTAHAPHHAPKDFSQSKNLAKENPKKLRELQDLWWAEAAKHNVLPLDATLAERADLAIRPSLTRGRTRF